MTNYMFLNTNSVELNSELLKQRGLENRDQSRFLSNEDWKKTRKRMVERQYVDAVQQRGYETYKGGYGSREKSRK